MQLKNMHWGKIIAGMFCISLLAVVIYKAINLPITHDELSASLGYATWKVWDILMSDVWPSNHILNTLLIKISENLFGIKPWSVRLSSIIAFGLFAYVIYLVAVRYFNRSYLFFCVPFFLMFSNPYLIDFFGLARGYGLSNTLMACSVYALLVFSSTQKSSWYYAVVIFAMLAAYANFTLLLFWLSVQILLVGIFLARSWVIKRPLKDVVIRVLITAVLAVLFLALCYVPLYKMNSTNQFIYWSKEGFYKNTILSLSIHYLYGVDYQHFKPTGVATFVLFVYLLTAVYSVYKLLSNFMYSLSNPLVVICILITLVWCVNLLQVVLLGVPFLDGRTALSYYVLFAFMFMFGLNAFVGHFNWRANVVAGLVGFMVMYHLHNAVTLHLVREWWFDANTYKVEDYLSKYQKQHPDYKTIDLNTNWIYFPSFTFDITTGKAPYINLTPYHKELDTASRTLFYYAIREESPMLKKYSPVMEFAEGGVLLIRNNP